MIIQTILLYSSGAVWTALPQPTALLYAAVLAELRAALVLWRYLDTLAGPTATSRNMLACLCPCERRIRVARATLAEARQSSAAPARRVRTR